MENYSKQREEIIEVLENSKNHPTAEEIYLKLISEADGDANKDESNTSVETSNVSDNTNTETKETPEVKEKETPEKADIDLDFSVELATEFSNTINEFTAVAANIVKTRKVTKVNTDKCYDLMSKIKNLLDAAKPIE